MSLNDPIIIAPVNPVSNASGIDFLYLKKIAEVTIAETNMWMGWMMLNKEPI